MDYLLRTFRRCAAFFTAAIFSGRFMRFQRLISSLLRPQLRHRSPLRLQTDMQGLSICFAIVVRLASAKGG